MTWEEYIAFVNHLLTPEGMEEWRQKFLDDLEKAIVFAEDTTTQPQETSSANTCGTDMGDDNGKQKHL